MESRDLTVAKIIGDPTCHGMPRTQRWPMRTRLSARSICAQRRSSSLVKLSVELAQDSANIEAMLQSALVSAMAGAIDAAGLNGTATNAALAPQGIFNYANRNKVTSIGAPTSWDFLADGMYELLLDNVPQERIGAMIAHPRSGRRWSKLKTGNSLRQFAASHAGSIGAGAEAMDDGRAPGRRDDCCGRSSATGAIISSAFARKSRCACCRRRFSDRTCRLPLSRYARCDFVAGAGSKFLHVGRHHR